MVRKARKDGEPTASYGRPRKAESESIDRGNVSFMNEFRKIILMSVAGAFIFAFMSVPAVNAQNPLREILGRMDSHYKALKSLKSDISRTKYESTLKDTSIDSGNLIMEPGKGTDFKLRLNWVKPRVETLSIANGKYQLYVPDIKRAYRGTTKSQKVSDSGGGVISVLNMSEAEMRAKYNVKYHGQVTLQGTEVWHIQLDPKTKQNFKFAELWVDKDGMPVQARITAHNNDTETFRLTDIKTNNKIDASVFRVTPAKGTEIIEQ